MGFILTLLYIVITIISPEQFGQEFASYHPMVYLAGITAVASFPGMLANICLRCSVQVKLLLGLIVAIAMSQVANGWFGGAVQSLEEILPVVASFFFIVANVTTVRRLKIIIWVTIGVCAAITIEALCGYYNGFRGDTFVLLQYGEIRRLRAAGFLSDPNDFAQILLIALPLLFVGWNRGRTIVNSLIVLGPAAFLLWAVYLTHSRGALIALGVLILLGLRKKMGNLRSLVLTGFLVIVMLAFGFTGGRGISASNGADRLELWSEGLQLFKRAPIFGVGFGRFADFSGLTAHNSFVLCLAELGLMGSMILVALFVTTLMRLHNIMTLEEEPRFGVEPAVELELESGITPLEWEPSSFESNVAIAITTDCEVMVAPEGEQGEAVLKPFAMASYFALVSFVTTSLFLSRSYTTTMYFVLGLATATIALEQPAIELPDRHRWVPVSLAVEASAIVLIYFVVRFRF